MSTIRIIAVPAGPEPLEIREAWVGLELPLANAEDFRTFPSDSTLYPVNPNWHLVNRALAIYILDEAGKIAAGTFWQDARGNFYLEFDPEVCELL